MDLPATPRLAENTPVRSQLWRCGQAVAFVVVWMALGWLFGLQDNTYLLLGVPLVAAFQLFVAKRPLRALWVRDSVKFELGAKGWLLLLALGAWPAANLVFLLRSADETMDLAQILWFGCATAGAAAAAFSLSRFTGETWKALFFCLATAGVIGCSLMVATWRMGALVAKPPNFWTGLSSLALYFPVSFVLEEVAFRGALDAHVHRLGDKNPWRTASFISLLWGLWHLPIAGAESVGATVLLALFLPLLHLPDGIFLSLGWRRGGNLAVPAFVHALIDAVRNMLLK